MGELLRDETIRTIIAKIAWQHYSVQQSVLYFHVSKSVLLNKGSFLHVTEHLEQKPYLTL